MEEIQDIIAKYSNDYLSRHLGATPEADLLALAYYEDVAEVLDVVTRLKNAERNPTGFSVDDAAILGLLVRSWKLLKLIIWIYREHSAEFVPIAERFLIEVSVTASYLLNSGDGAIEDYRRCSYKNRLRMLAESASGLDYFRSKAGQRLVRSIRHKLSLEGLDEHSFAAQERNGWRLQGKTFHGIFKEVMGEELYATAYGTSSESVHGSWQDVLAYSLQGNTARGFLPLYERLRVSIGNVSLVMPFATMPFRDWTQRAELDEPYINDVLDFVEKINLRLFVKFGERLYGT